MNIGLRGITHGDARIHWPAGRLPFVIRVVERQAQLLATGEEVA